jgi:hypothetical protein
MNVVFSIDHAKIATRVENIVHSPFVLFNPGRENLISMIATGDGTVGECR